MDAVTAVEVRDAARPPQAEARAAGRMLGAVALLGVAVSALTWRAGWGGAGWLAADALMVGVLLGRTRRARASAAPWIFGGASVWLAAASVWYASDWAQATALPGSVLALLLAGMVTARRTPVTATSAVGGHALDAARALPGAVVDAARTPLRAVRGGASGHLSGVARGVLVGVPLAGLFSILLSADAHFRKALIHMLHLSGEGVSFGAWTLLSAAALLVAGAVLARLERSAAAVPPADPAWLALPYRAEGDLPLPGEPVRGPRVRAVTWGAVLGPVVAVFGVYTAASAGTLFVGHDYLRAAGTEAYAQYLHEGFLQVSVATLLAVACVVCGHLLLRPREGGKPVAGGRGLALVELALLGLVGLTLASCAHRLALYEEAYGYTYLRLGVWLLQLGVAGLLAMTAARCVARGWRGWGTALVWSGLAFGLLAGSIDVDGWIARRNVARALGGERFDSQYLMALSEDARGVLPAVRHIDQDAAEELERTWEASRAEHRGAGWRSLRGLGAR